MRRALVSPKIMPLHSIHSSASRIITRLMPTRQRRTGSSSFVSAETIRIGTQNSTFSTIRDIVATPLSVEPREYCTASLP